MHGCITNYHTNTAQWIANFTRKSDGGGGYGSSIPRSNRLPVEPAHSLWASAPPAPSPLISCWCESSSQQPALGSGTGEGVVWLIIDASHYCRPRMVLKPKPRPKRVQYSTVALYMFRVSRAFWSPFTIWCLFNPNNHLVHILTILSIWRSNAEQRRSKLMSSIL